MHREHSATKFWYPVAKLRLDFFFNFEACFPSFPQWLVVKKNCKHVEITIITKETKHKVNTPFTIARPYEEQPSTST